MLFLNEKAKMRVGDVPEKIDPGRTINSEYPMSNFVYIIIKILLKLLGATSPPLIKRGESQTKPPLHIVRSALIIFALDWRGSNVPGPEEILQSFRLWEAFRPHLELLGGVHINGPLEDWEAKACVRDYHTQGLLPQINCLQFPWGKMYQIAVLTGTRLTS